MDMTVGLTLGVAAWIKMWLLHVLPIKQNTYLRIYFFYASSIEEVIALFFFLYRVKAVFCLLPLSLSDWYI